MSVKSKKDVFRKNAILRLKKHSKISAKSASYPVLRSIKELIKLKQAKKVLLYMPLVYELDVYKLRRYLYKSDIFVPFMQNVSLKMVKLKLPFNIKKFNIREPVASKEIKDRIDMAIVPCIGVDGAMSRIGHGKGFYDRFFDSLSYRPKTIVFVQIKDFYTGEILSYKHDLCGDYYLTPRANYTKRGKYDRSFSRLRSRCSGSWRRISLRKKDK